MGGGSSSGDSCGKERSSLAFISFLFMNYSLLNSLLFF
jgi:hypothetical protein